MNLRVIFMVGFHSPNLSSSTPSEVAEKIADYIFWMVEHRFYIFINLW